MKSKDDQINQKIIENYELLSETGILQYIEELNHLIVNKNELIREGVEIFNKRTIVDLVNYITDKLLKKFIPETLNFIIQKDSDPESPHIISFKKMKPAKAEFTVDNFSQFKEFFSLSPTSITYDALKVMMDTEESEEKFKIINPELFVPIMGLDGVYGFIIFGTKVSGEKYNEDEMEFIDEIMNYASISLQNIIHYTRAITDLKTMLYNHDYFMQSFTRELSRVKRYQSEFGLLMMDIDHFKNVNDTYGHVAGDKIIKIVANTIIDIVRTEDIPARFGGEEFVVILTECKKDYVMDVAERIRKKIESYVIKNDDDIIKLTISIGVYHVSKYTVDKPDVLLEKVDKALYTAKEGGRNKCIFYHDDDEDK